ncbi:MAG TPA: alcohol dehydrogenase [Propionibacteriaceae bacterium]|jgi:threonine dehydrogenase-like Zn-dependent dehydrogenase|nr:alcohol dehydrogenase [Propionibacteriaceae bacterium]HBY24807.1 alcohol dehydrogenase [Propionibacteriaceae bacterium]
MKAFVLTGPGRSEVQDLAPPVPMPGEAVIDVARVGVCGTDVEFFTGEMQYLHDGHSKFPLYLGHEWCGTVSAVGADQDDRWVGRRVTGDTMLGCGHCRRCQSGRHHVCENRSELGIRGAYRGALAEQFVAPVSSMRALPDTVDDTAGALVEPGGNAWRSLEAAQLTSGERVLVLGPGTIGLLVAEFARARGIEVHLGGRSQSSLDYASSLGFENVWAADDVPSIPYDAVIDASNAPSLPARAVRLVEPGRRVVFVGLAGTASLVDSRELALKDVTAVGILGASAGLTGTIEAYASGAVDPRGLVAATVGLHQAHDVLAGWRPDGAAPGPKLLVDPRVHG